MKKVRKYVVSAALLAVIALTAGFIQSPDIYFLIKKNFTIFSEVYKTISLNYVDEVDPEELMRTGVDAMLESLDPYTVLLDENKRQSLQRITVGSYGGVGLEVGYRGGKVVVIAPIEGHPAYKKGIRAGDVIIEVDGKSTKNLTPDEVQAATSGEVGTLVKLTIQRYGVDQPLDFELKRERIDIKSVGYAGLIGNDEIGYILLNRFSQNSAEEVEEAIQELQKQGTLSGLVLDLRNNPGGLLEEAVEIMDKFVPAGITIVETRGRSKEHTNYFETKTEPTYPHLPLIIVQNKGSASAAEIIAGAMQDLDRAVVIGERSFGKGLVQIVEPISYNMVLKMTASRYYLPSGRSIEFERERSSNTSAKMDSIFKTVNGRKVYGGNGITPDVKLSPDESTSWLQTSLMQQNQFFNFANRYVAQNDSLQVTIESDELFGQFLEFLDQQNFEYEHPSEKDLSSIDSTLHDIKGIDTHINALKKNIEAQKKRAFIEEREEISRKLYLELLSRYKGQQGTTAASLPHDPFINEALIIIQNEEQYNEILSLN